MVGWVFTHHQQFLPDLEPALFGRAFFKHGLEGTTARDLQAATGLYGAQYAGEFGQSQPDMVAHYGQNFRLLLNGFLHLGRTNGMDAEVVVAYEAFRLTLQSWRRGPSG